MAYSAANQRPFQTELVAEVFSKYSDAERAFLMHLRELIFSIAERTEGVGQIEETLKWGQLSYLTPQTKSGTTIRIDADRTEDGGLALYVNCQTTLVQDWRERYPSLTYSGNRSIHFNLADPLPKDEISHCIGMALTYHSAKKTRAGAS